MPKLQNRPPSYRHHRRSGQAVVTVHGRDVYLGAFGSPESKAAYGRAIADWAARSDEALSPGAMVIPKSDPIIAELVAAFLNHSATYYRRPDGTPTGEHDQMVASVRPLRQLYSRHRVADFTPTCLKSVRDAMIKAELSRGLINSRVNRIRRVFRWGVENELVSPGVLQALAAVAPLKAGRTVAREAPPVRPVPPEHIEAILPFLTRPVRAMVQLQATTGARPGEILVMRPCDITIHDDAPWEFRPATHKLSHHGIDRCVFLGPRAQAVLAPFLELTAQDAYCFSPRDAILDLRRRLPGKPASARQRLRMNGYKSAPRHRYTTNSYAGAIRVACKKAGVPHWSPNRIRHFVATKLRAAYGLDAAKTMLGHRNPSTTLIYAEADFDKARSIATVAG